MMTTNNLSKVKMSNKRVLVSAISRRISHSQANIKIKTAKMSLIKKSTSKSKVKQCKKNSSLNKKDNKSSWETLIALTIMSKSPSKKKRATLNRIFKQRDLGIEILIDNHMNNKTAKIMKKWR